MISKFCVSPSRLSLASISFMQVDSLLILFFFLPTRCLAYCLPIFDFLDSSLFSPCPTLFLLFYILFLHLLVLSSIYFARFIPPCTCCLLFVACLMLFCFSFVASITIYPLLCSLPFRAFLFRTFLYLSSILIFFVLSSRPYFFFILSVISSFFLIHAFEVSVLLLFVLLILSFIATLFPFDLSHLFASFLSMLMFLSLLATPISLHLLYALSLLYPAVMCPTISYFSCYFTFLVLYCMCFLYPLFFFSAIRVYFVLVFSYPFYLLLVSFCALFVSSFFSPFSFCLFSSIRSLSFHLLSVFIFPMSCYFFPHSYLAFLCLAAVFFFCFVFLVSLFSSYFFRSSCGLFSLMSLPSCCLCFVCCPRTSLLSVRVLTFLYFVPILSHSDFFVLSFLPIVFSPLLSLSSSLLFLMF